MMYIVVVKFGIWEIKVLYCGDEMDGICVGNRLIGIEVLVIIGWENIFKVEGGLVK